MTEHFKTLLTAVLIAFMLCPNMQASSDSRFFMSTDFLYWKATEGGTEYGQVANFYANIPASPLSTGQNFFGNELDVDSRFKPGVRTTLGFQPEPDSWQTNLIWTHLNTHASGASNNPDAVGGPVVIPNPLFYLPQPLNNNGINATADWSANYNTLDLDLNKELFQSKSVRFQAHVGLRNVWLNQTYNILSLKTYDSATPPTLFVNGESNMVQTMYGIGPVLGSSSQWNIYRGFDLCGEASFALIRAHVRSSVVGTILADQPTETVDRRTTFDTTLPQMNLSVGAQYRFDIGSRYRVSTRVAWELQTLFNANYLGGTTVSEGNFNAGGLTTGISLNF